jgi:hypothetical protein
VGVNEAAAFADAPIDAVDGSFLVPDMAAISRLFRAPRAARSLFQAGHSSGRDSRAPPDALRSTSNVSTWLHPGHLNDINSGRPPSFGTLRASIINFVQAGHLTGCSWSTSRVMA